MLVIPLSLSLSHVVQDFEKVDSRCPEYVREAFVEIMELAAQGDEGLGLL